MNLTQVDKKVMEEIKEIKKRDFKSEAKKFEDLDTTRVYKSGKNAASAWVVEVKHSL